MLFNIENMFELINNYGNANEDKKEIVLLIKTILSVCKDAEKQELLYNDVGKQVEIFVLEKWFGITQKSSSYAGAMIYQITLKCIPYRNFVYQDVYSSIVNDSPKGKTTQIHP